MAGRPRIIESPGGYVVRLNGREYGTWRSRAEALGGLAVELRRIAAREEAERRQIAADCATENEETF